jgi:DUF4097 and DUF4098 domain-containing protein YvlB
MATYATPEPIEATVEVIGDVRLTASDRTDTDVVVRPRDPSKAADVRLAEETLVECSAGRLMVKTPKSWRRFTPFGGYEAVDITIELPTGSTAVVDTVMGDVTTDGELGACRIKTGMGAVRLDQTEALQAKSGFGNVSVDRILGDAQLKTGSGDVRVGVVEGAATITNSNGNTTVDDVAGDLQVKAANGAIVVGRARASATTKTACGPIQIGEVGAGSVVAETAAGELEVGVRPGVAVWLDLKTSFGTVRSSLSSEGGAPSATDATVTVRGRTSAGDILIGPASVEDVADRDTGSEAR